MNETNRHFISNININWQKWDDTLGLITSGSIPTYNANILFFNAYTYTYL